MSAAPFLIFAVAYFARSIAAGYINRAPVKVGHNKSLTVLDCGGPPGPTTHCQNLTAVETVPERPNFRREAVALLHFGLGQWHQTEH